MQVIKMKYNVKPLIALLTVYLILMGLTAVLLSSCGVSGVDDDISYTQAERRPVTVPVLSGIIYDETGPDITPAPDIPAERFATETLYQPPATIIQHEIEYTMAPERLTEAAFPSDTTDPVSADDETAGTTEPDGTPEAENRTTEFHEKPEIIYNVEGYSWTESDRSGITVRDNYDIPEGVISDPGGEKSIDVGEDKTLRVVSVAPGEEGQRTDYKPAESIISPEISDYLMHQTSSNSYSHVTDPFEIVGTNIVLEGLPFYYVPGFIAGSNISKTEIDYDDVDANGILGAVYEKCDHQKALLWGLNSSEASEDYLVAVYVDCGHEYSSPLKSCGESLVKDFFYDRVEYHCGIKVTRMAEYPDQRSDYFFLAFPLLNGKYVIRLGGGVIILNRIPERSLNIYFDNGGGDLGFYGLQLACDGNVVFECDRFDINGTSLVTSMY
ncbi:MAG: hypothetical protein K6G89_03080 [Clostridia bacterium]|nr:hypothetical protein [Clostridia bacterium]